MPAPTNLSDVARKALRSTLLIHDVDAIDSVLDLTTIVIGTANATRNLEPRHIGVSGQAPTVRFEGSGANHNVTIEGVVWGVDTRLITIGVPFKVNDFPIGSAVPAQINLGVCFAEVQGWSFQTLTGVQANDFAQLGYDLSGPVVLLGDTSAQATRPTIFVANNAFGPLVPMPTANLTSQKRHSRWGTGKPTATTASAVFIVPPAVTVV